MKRWFGAAFVAVLALGLAFRAPELTLRPLHNDESVNTFKFRDLYERNAYRYDPNEYHGPTLEYLTLVPAWLGGARPFNDYSEAMFRAAPVACGLGLILILLPLAGDLGRRETLFAALFTAISPAMTYYSRDYIHEILLTFFTALAFVGAWRFAQTKRMAWACAAGVGLGLMAATKETFVFALASMAAAVIWVRWRDQVKVFQRPCAGGLMAVGIAVVVALLFFTSFFKNPGGAVDALRAYLPWVHRAGGASPHVHPWYFYLQRLFFFHEPGRWFWSEWIVGVLAVAGFFAARTPLSRIIGWYTLCLTIIYCALPYKTPWCLLGFYDGMIALAGIGAAALLENCRQPQARRLAALFLILGAGHLGFQAWRCNFGTFRETAVCAQSMNPYVYAQTSPDLLRLVDTAEGLAKVSPQGMDTLVEVMSPDSYWPLPWYLRRFKQVGYWDKIPPPPLAPIMIAAKSLDARFDEQRGRTHLMAGYFEIRPGVFLELYVSVDLWGRYVAAIGRR